MCVRLVGRNGRIICQWAKQRVRIEVGDVYQIDDKRHDRDRLLESRTTGHLFPREMVHTIPLYKWLVLHGERREGQVLHNQFRKKKICTART